MQAWAAVLLVAPLVLAGCTGLGEDAFVTAMEHRDRAQDLAEHWSGNATLTWVMGLEPSRTIVEDVSTYGSDDDLAPLVQRADPDVGDGHAQAWLFGFVAPGVGEWYVTIAANGTVLESQEDLDEKEKESPAITAWQVDSDRAVAIAKENNATWANVTSEHNVALALGPSKKTAAPVWALGIEDDDGSDVAWVMVNATSGEYLGAIDVDFGPFDVPFLPLAEHGEFEDEVTLAEPTHEHTFEIDEDGHRGLTVKAENDLPSGTINITLHDPEDQVVNSVTLGDQNSVGQAVIWTEAPQPGTWRITVELEEGLAQRYWIGWCTTGFHFDLDVSGPAEMDRPDPCEES